MADKESSEKSEYEHWSDALVNLIKDICREIVQEELSKHASKLSLDTKMITDKIVQDMRIRTGINKG